MSLDNLGCSWLLDYESRLYSWSLNNLHLPSWSLGNYSLRISRHRNDVSILYDRLCSFQTSCESSLQTAINSGTNPTYEASSCWCHILIDRVWGELCHCSQEVFCSSTMLLVHEIICCNTCHLTSCINLVGEVSISSLISNYLCSSSRCISNNSLEVTLNSRTDSRAHAC